MLQLEPELKHLKGTKCYLSLINPHYTHDIRNVTCKKCLNELKEKKVRKKVSMKGMFIGQNIKKIHYIHSACVRNNVELLKTTFVTGFGHEVTCGNCKRQLIAEKKISPKIVGAREENLRNSIIQPK